MSIDAKTGKPHLEFFRVGEDGWVEITPGVRQKILAGGLDKTNKRGFLNRLVRWAPGATIDAIIVHEFYEEVFVVSGELLVGAQDDRTRFESFRRRVLPAARRARHTGRFGRARRAACCSKTSSICEAA